MKKIVVGLLLPCVVMGIVHTSELKSEELVGVAAQVQCAAWWDLLTEEEAEEMFVEHGFVPDQRWFWLQIQIKKIEEKVAELRDQLKLEKDRLDEINTDYVAISLELAALEKKSIL